MSDEKTPEQTEREHCERVVGNEWRNEVIVDLLMRERHAVRAEMQGKIDARPNREQSEALARGYLELKAQLDTAREQRDTYYAGMKEANADLLATQGTLERVTQEHDELQFHHQRLIILKDERTKERDAALQKLRAVGHEVFTAAQLRGELQNLRTAAERVYKIAERDTDEFNALRAALDSTKPTSEPEQPTPDIEPTYLDHLSAVLRQLDVFYRCGEPVIPNEAFDELAQHHLSLHDPDYDGPIPERALARAERCDTFDPAKVRELVAYVLDNGAYMVNHAMGLAQAVRASEVK